MLATKLISLLAAFAATQAAPTSPQPYTDYGSWSIEIVIGASATGYRFGDLYAQHSSNPSVTSHSKWVYSPIFQNTTFTPDDPTLRNTLIDTIGVKEFTIQQTLPLNGENVALKGTGEIEIKFYPAANGRGGKGSGTINAELDA